jgi:hypothetical protein
VTLPRSAAIVLSVLLLAGCDQLQQFTTPNPVVPADVRSTHTAAEAAQKMLAEIAASEKKLGRSLAPARIIKIQLLHAGELYGLNHLDGTNPERMGVSPTDGPGWVVEAVGTFVGVDPGSGQIDALGTHGLHLWDDQGGESAGFIPCWTRLPVAAEEMEGVCAPPGA